ncbi:MAG: hypothetical protein IK111_03415 [Lachnospiraceae bacterium]|nr:hypothetical protein [Lachnospiraceae bacterium]
MSMYFKSRKATLATAAILTAVMSLTGCKDDGPKTSIMDSSNEVSSYSETSDSTDTGTDINADIDLDSLNKSIDAINDLKFDIGSDTGSDSNNTESNAVQAGDSSDSTKDEPSGEKTVYSFTDVYADENDLTVIPNGGMNASTVLYGGKDLKGFLDYVDSNVLEKGRTINRDFFYDMLAVMMVDKDLSSDADSIEKNLIMSLAMANNFHDTDVKINDCYLNAANAAEYRYHVTAYGKDDTWVVNYRDRTMYMNDGKTEYVSEMFKDEYLAVWMVAIEDYYGLVFK